MGDTGGDFFTRDNRIIVDTKTNEGQELREIGMERASGDVFVIDSDELC